METLHGAEALLWPGGLKPRPRIVRGEGVWLWDDVGRRYLDGIGGIHVNSIGHGVAEVADAIASQARKVAFAFGAHFTTDVQLELAERVVAMAPPGMARVHFVSGGSEATEVALQLARQYHLARGQPTRWRAIGRWHGYHGSTVGALSVTGHLGRRRDYAPYLLDFPHISPPCGARCRLGRTDPSACLACADELAVTIEREGPDTIAAFVAEPVVGTTAGALVPPAGYYERIRQICDRYGVLFVADEVITGFGRTGRTFGIEHWRATPDLLTSAKGLSSGYAPIGAVVVHERVAAALERGRPDGYFVGYTFSGNPVSCAAALAVQDYLARHRLVERCAAIGEQLKARLAALGDRFESVGEVRGLGLLLGIELVRDRATGAPFARRERVQERVVAAALAGGLAIVGGTGRGEGADGDHLLVTPPFVIDQAECDQLVALLADALGAAGLS
ncbi:MAG TPA: aspartate aminotransferase family protein [Chloroflexota bacterium]